MAKRATRASTRRLQIGPNNCNHASDEWNSKVISKIDPLVQRSPCPGESSSNPSVVLSRRTVIPLGNRVRSERVFQTLEKTSQTASRAEVDMKAIVIHGYGGPEVLRYEDYPDPVPSAGEVLVRVTASSVNPFDFKIRSGSLKDFIPLSFPAVPGL